MTSRLRAVALAAAAAVFWQPLSVATGIVAAAAGALVAAPAADHVARTSADAARRLRVTSWLGLALATSTVGVLVAHGLTAFAFPANVVGPIATFHAGEAVRLVALTTAVVFALRLLARQHPALGVLELGAVAALLVGSLAAHREGMIHRPFVFGDFAWRRGIDPTWVFLLLGGLFVLLLAVLLVSERRRSRLPLHFAVLLLVAGGLAALVNVSGLPQPRAPRDLGLTGETKSKGGEGRSSEGGGSGQMDELEFKDDYPSGGGRSPVAVVVLRDDYSPPSGVYYFRQTAFSRFNGQRLVQGGGGSIDRDLVHEFPSAPIEVPVTPPNAVERMPLATTTGLLLDHIKPFALDSPVTLAPAPNPEGLRFQRVFEALSLVPTDPYEALLGQRPGHVEWSEKDWATYTEGPTDERYGGLAEELVAPLPEEFRGDALAQALAVKLYLDENGIYSRKNDHADAADPAASFLFGDLTGYCVHFAHAAVYMFRSLGIPARVAAGYAVPEADRGEGSAVMIRGLDAHAWPEIHLEGAGWVVVDLAPQQTLDELAPRPDAALQQMLGEMLRRQARGDPPLPETEAPGPTAAELLGWAAAMLAAALAAAFAVKLARALAPAFADGDQQYRVSYRAALDRLAEVGLRRRFGESRERFAARAEATAPSFGALTRAHLASALGSGRAAPSDIRRLAEATRGEIAARTPGWRVALGWLNPLAWLFAR